MKGVPGVGLAALLLLACCGEKKRAPAVDFVAYGDCRHQPNVHRKVAAAIAASGGKDFLVAGVPLDGAVEVGARGEVPAHQKDAPPKSPLFGQVPVPDRNPKKPLPVRKGVLKT